MSLAKKFAIAATMALPLLLSGCGTPVTALCPADGTGPGTATLTQTFTDAAPQTLCRVSGDALQPNGRYALSGGSVLIDGNVPAGVRIDVNGGKLFVNGHVGTDARLEAKVPEDISTYTTIVPIWNGKTLMMIPQTNYKFEGYTHEADTGPAITVTGAVGNDARLTSNHGMAVGGGVGEHVRIDHTRKQGYDNITTGPQAAVTVNRVLGL